ncbi:MAG: Shikimate dehydrogenase (NADP(+)) [Firmicutes bacterium]|nr:Shikimate dehydrogenase (NADP(+)) [Bacillota bacterium]
MIDVETKLVGLLGSPLKQSFSPAMQNRAFKAAGLNYYYFPIEVTTEGLRDVLQGIRRMNFAGCNVTKPNKIEVLQYLDAIDTAALAIGAVNTVKVVDGQLIGYNTDGLGFAAYLEQDEQIHIPGTRFFVLGCGGAGRAIATVLAAKGAKAITLTDMSEAASANLADSIDEHFAYKASCLRLGTPHMQDALAEADVIINATAVGMSPHIGDIPLPSEWLSAGGRRLAASPSLLDSTPLVCDIIYNPPTTRLMREAAAVGCRTANGLGMVIYQGAAAFTIWTGIAAPVAEMKETILELSARFS